MPTRVLLEVALRIMGMWWLAMGLVNFTAITMMFFTPWGNEFPDYIFQMGIQFVFLCGFGLVLVVMAPSVAAYFYPDREGEVSVEDASAPDRIGPGHLLRIACFLFGVYLLVQAAEPAARLLVTLMRAGSASMDVLSDVVVTLIRGGVGLWLVLGSQGISRFIAGLGYDPDAVPPQRFSLGVLMVLLVGFAIVLGLIRAMSTEFR